MTTPNFLPVPEVKYTQKSAILGEFEVSVHGSLLHSKMQDAFARLQKKVKMPGFREGKVPIDLVKKKYHEDVLHEVFQNLVSETYRRGATENKVPAVGSPFLTKTNLDAWKDGELLQYTVQVDDRDRVQRVLNDADIPTAVHYPIGLHQQPVVEKITNETLSFPITERCAQRVMSLPFHPYLEKESVQMICEKLIKISVAV